MAYPRLLLALLLLSFLCFASSPVSANKVSVSLYYEALCPYCSSYIVNNLVRIFRNGLISIVDLDLVPYGNARLTSDGSIICQHGENECLLNAIEACAIRMWPDVQQHFGFVRCVEHKIMAQGETEWQSCFQETGLSSEGVLHCYNSGNAEQLELQYAAETGSLQPAHQYVPWVVIDGQPLYDDYLNFEAHICRAYEGELPEACKGLTQTISEELKASRGDQVCLADETIS
ncbi:gamma-interferon-responsive lysosomal thiol protein-like [Typha latifolia]|uniref:gamma-interferon-responsive lysosomal thiol protein-like n=1 Tax=Typha latifolia TaxID=4733 RepID=UPI003C2BC4F2